MDPRLVATYDIENAGRDDVEHYLRLASEIGARSAIDLACGTGVLAVELAQAGLDVVGVDPANAMLDIARARPGGDRVRWVLGTSAALGEDVADLIVMTGHAAQVFLDDEEWGQTLADCWRALRPGGHLAFETRNPDAQGWSSWNRASSFRTFPLPDGAKFDSWVEVTSVRLPLVDFVGHVQLPGQPLRTVPSTLRFRTAGEVEQSLTAAGFTMLTVVGDWDGAPLQPTSRELIFLAQR